MYFHMYIEYVFIDYVMELYAIEILLIFYNIYIKKLYMHTHMDILRA